jgi:hypothetical protein
MPGMTDAPRKPFWKRKRWIAAAVLWLVILYPASLPGIAWLCRFQFVPRPVTAVLEVFYAPLSWLCYPDPTPGFGWYRQVVEFVADQ